MSSQQENSIAVLEQQPTAVPVQSIRTPIVDRIGEYLARPQILIRIALYLTGLIYARTVLFEFAYDDVSLILLNPWMASWKSVPVFFTHSFWGFAEFPRPTDYYRPLVMLFFAIIHHTLLFPAWFHIWVVAVHVLTVYLAYRVALELTKDATLSAIAAAIFGLHPTKIESVAWISGVSDSLCMMFLLASLLVYLRWKNKGSPGYVPWTSVLLLLLASLSKEMAVVTPALIGVYELLTADTAPFDRVKTAFKRSLPYGVAAAVVIALRIHAMPVFVGPVQYHYRFVTSFYTAPRSVIWYLVKQIWPLPISLQYPVVTVNEPSLRMFFLPLLGVVLLATLVVLLIRKSATGWFLLTWFVLMLVPVLVFGAILQVHDRHMYAPSFATSVALAYLIVLFARRARNSANLRIAAIVSVVCVGFAVMTTLELRYWGDEIKLFERTVEIGPNRVDGYSALAGAYLDRKDLDNAERVGYLWIQKAADPFGGWLIIGEVRRQREDFRGSQQAFEAAMREAKNPISVAFAAHGLGSLALKEGRASEAAHWYEIATKGQPTASFLHDFYGRALIQMGDNEAGQRELKVARALRRAQGL